MDRFVDSNFRLSQLCLKRALVFLLFLSSVASSYAQGQSENEKLPVEKFPVPTSKRYSAALKKIATVLGDEMQTRDRAQRIRVAEKLLTIANEESDPVSIYVLLDQARQLGVENGSLKTAWTSIQQLNKRYEIDYLKTIESDVKDSLGNVQTAKEFAETIDVAIEISNLANENKNLDFAIKVIEHARRAARKTKDPQFIAQVESQRQKLLELRKLKEAFEKANAKLKTNSDDDKSRVTVGSYLYFIAEQPEQGLAVLAESDSPYGDAAQAETRLGKSLTDAPTEELVNAAERWFQIGAKDKSLLGQKMNSRSLQLLSVAYAKAQGLEKNEIEKILIKVRQAGVDNGGGNVVEIACLRPWYVKWSSNQEMKSLRFTPTGNVSWTNSSGGKSNLKWKLDNGAIVFGEKMILGYRFQMKDGKLIASLIHSQSGGLKESKICQPE